MTQTAGTAHGRPDRRILGFDAARAAAIACVMICHFGIVGVVVVAQIRPPLVLSLAGYFGVELFFVLSGYLIGSVLIDIRAAGGGWRAGVVFLVRRWMRTLPAYYAVLSIVAASGAVAVTGWQLFDYVTLTQNLAWPMRAPDFFAVSWSLTIEEWFYILVGFVLITMARRGRLFALGWIGLFLVLPLVLRCEVPASADWDDEIRKVVCTRLDAILYGGLAIDLVRRRLPPAARLACAIGGAGVIALLGLYWICDIGTWSIARQPLRVLVFNVTGLSFAVMFPWLEAMAPLGRPADALAGWLSRRSYSLYLVHLPILDLVFQLRDRPYGLQLAAWAASLAGTVLAAEILYRAIERPFMRMRPAQPEPRTRPDRPVAGAPA